MRFDHFLLDSFFRLRGPVSPGKDIVLVALDRSSAVRMSRKTTTWQRKDFAGAIDTLTEAGADLIAVDYIFSLPDDDVSQDEALSAAMERSANVILASDISENNLALPLERFRRQEVGEGFINFFPDEDDFVREVPPLHAKTGDRGEPLIDALPFSVQIALARLYPESNFAVDLSENKFIGLGSLRIPYSGTGRTSGFWINFCGPSQTFPVIPIHRILRKDFSASEIKGKIVFIGNMNPLHHDYYPVPFQSATRGNSGSGPKQEERSLQGMYGVEIHANAVQTLLSRRFISPVSRRNQVLLLLAFTAVASWLAIGAPWTAFVSAGASLLLMGAFWLLAYLFFLRGTFLPSAPQFFAMIGITLTGILARQAKEAAEKRFITQMFGRYVSPTVVQELVRNRDLVQLKGRKQRLTVFFSDIRGFTPLSEKLAPEEVSALLNEYFGHMTRIVFQFGGTLDKFMGDAIMAFFGNPVFFEDHAIRAVEMAVAMKEEMQGLKTRWQEQGKPYVFDIGMGINTGEMVVGNLGSDEFFDYTVIGDEVNLASRLQAVAREGQIIISENTYHEVQGRFTILPLEPVKVKGKSEPVPVYEVTGKFPEPERKGVRNVM